MATVGLGLIAIVLGIAFEKMNIAFMIGLAFGVAAAANFPVLILSMYWKGLTTRGALWGGYGGVISSVLFVLLSKSVWVDVIGMKASLFPYTQPAIFCMPIGFGLAWLMSVTDKSARAELEKEAFEDQFVRAQTGLGASGASVKH
jgi:cation/acetate symporter